MELNIYLGLVLVLIAVLILGGLRLLGQRMENWAVREKRRQQDAMHKLMDPARKGWDD